MLSNGSDPCGNISKDSLLAIYIKLLCSGENVKNKNELRSATVAGYVTDINKLHRLRHLPPPIDLKGDSKAAQLYKNLSAEEDIARRRQPIDPAVAANIFKAGTSAPPDSKEALIRDIIALGRMVGPRAAEIVQKTAKKPDYHQYPSGKKVLKSLSASNFTFYDKKGHRISSPCSKRQNIETMKITWFIQKNRRNGETLTYARERDNPALCPVLAVLRMLARARRLGQPSDLPLCVHADRSGAMRYLTATSLTQYLRTQTKKEFPQFTKSELGLISCHSLRVWACVLLSEAGEDGDRIRIRLRWLSEAYRVYLRDTSAAASSHNKALKQNSAKISTSIPPASLLPVNGYNAEIDEEMGEYQDLL